MGGSLSKCCKSSKKYEGREKENNGKGERDGNKKDGDQKQKNHPQQPVTNESTVKLAINRGNTLNNDDGDGLNKEENHYIRPNIGQDADQPPNIDKEKKKKKKRKKQRKTGRRRRRDPDSSDTDSSDSSTSSSSSSSSYDDNGGGKTTKSKRKKVNKDGSVTYIKNKTTIGSSKTTFKAGRNIIINKNKNTYSTVQQKPEKSRQLFKQVYTEKTARTKEQELFSLIKETRPILGQLVNLRGRDNVVSAFKSGVLYDCSQWVGQIKFPGGNGTCFRVGTNYVMTALHVVQLMFNSFKDYEPVRGKEGPDEFSKLSVLSDHSVFVDFLYFLEDHRTADRNKFHFKHIQTLADIPFFDEETDVIVLELDTKPGQVLPLPFTNFGIPKLDKEFHLITHSEGNPKEIDKVTKLVDMDNLKTKQDIEILRTESKRYIQVNNGDPRKYPCETPPHNMLTNPSRLLFSCASSKGASGSPGIQITANGQIVVVTMLLHGYPDFFYDKDCELLKANWPKEYTIEQGVNFASVFAKMKKNNSSLSDEIFPASDNSNPGSFHVLHPSDKN